MDETISFDLLLSRLPKGQFAGAGTPEFMIPEVPGIFVPPTLKTIETSDEPNVTLISARGATGKSMLAESISARKNVPLWRLDRDLSVSGHAFGAKLDRYVGSTDGLSALERLNDAFVVVDALDEGRMRVSGISWNEYIESLAQAANSGHSLVLLGRERVLDDVWVSLASAGITLEWFEISHFDTTQRVEYIDSKIGHDRDPANPAYIAARSAVLQALAGAVDVDQAESFVGYAPVLDAVVALLRKGNLLEIQNIFASEGRGGRSVGVLIDILIQLLERERTKTKPLAEQLNLNPDDVYTPAEQVQWLVADLMGGDEPKLEWCPDIHRAEYAAQVEEFLRDHPFRSENRWASPVFSAYVASEHFGDPQLRPALGEIGKATGLLFEFVSATGEELLIDEWQFAALHSSLLAAELQAVEVNVSIEESEAGAGNAAAGAIEQTSGEMVLMEGKSVYRSTSFVLVLDRPGVVSLTGPLASLSVTFPAAVSIGGPEASISLGPDCFIRCSDLYIGGDTLQVSRRQFPDAAGAGLGDSNVVFEVTEHFSCTATLTGNPSPGSFTLRVPVGHRLTYPWVNYREEVELSAPPPNERAVRFLNMLMNLLRNHGHKGSMAVFDKKLEGRQSIKGSDFQNVISKLQSMGVLYQDGPLIFLTAEWEQQRFSGKAREGIVTLNEQIDTWRPVLDAIASVIAN
jgi:hypothetical protein